MRLNYSRNCTKTKICKKQWSEIRKVRSWPFLLLILYLLWHCHLWNLLSFKSKLKSCIKESFTTSWSFFSLFGLQETFFELSTYIYNCDAFNKLSGPLFNHLHNTKNISLDKALVEAIPLSFSTLKVAKTILLTFHLNCKNEFTNSDVWGTWERVGE